MRPTSLLAAELKYGQGQSFALFALLCFHAERFDARIDDHGCIIILEDQDRSKWNKELIERGLEFLHRSSQSKQLSAYHLEASIAALHCTTPSFAETNWKQIHEWYDHLEKLKPTPVIRLNSAIISGKIYGADQAINTLIKLSEDPGLAKYYLLYASQGQFYVEQENYQNAVICFEKATKLTKSEKEKSY